MEASLERRGTKVRSLIYDQMPTTNLVKIGQVDPEIICLKGFINFKMRSGVHADDALKPAESLDRRSPNLHTV